MKHDRDIPFSLLNVATSKCVRNTGLAFLMLCVMGVPVSAAQAIDDTQDTPKVAMTKENRQLIMQGLQAVKQKRWTEARQIFAQTQDKSAIALYDWLYFTRTEGSVEFSRISEFIKDHPDWPRQDALKELAEKSMPEGMAEAEVASWFNQYEPQSAEGMNRYAQALINQGQGTQAKQKLEDWWPKARLDNQQQATFIRRYGDMISDDVHVARFNTTLFRKQYTNARALATIIGKGYPALVEARIGLAENTPGVDRLVNAVPAQLQDDPGFMLERLRWRRKNNMDFGAIEILHKMPPAAQIPNMNDWWKERNIMARRLIDKKDYKSAYLVVSKHGMKEGADFAAAEFMAGWLALRFNKQAD
ncbi:MAG: hypothetical protein NDJ24_10190, partial [Alphaproteobacteria bacterium]|nr:hypothetical protein [Alphaproteobacteria bacterium]